MPPVDRDLGAAAVIAAASPSELQVLATSQWNPILSSTTLAVITAIVLARALLIRRALFDIAVLVLATFWILVVALRESYIQNFLWSTCHLNLAEVRFLAHASAVLSGSAMLLLVVAWRSPHKIARARLAKVITACCAPAVVCLAVMIVVSWPALMANRAIEHYPGREAIYAIVYAIVPASAALIIVREGILVVRARGATRASRLVGTLISVLAGVSAIDHLDRAWTGIQIYRDPHHIEIVLARAHATDWALLPPLAIIFLSIVPMMVIDVERRIRHDSDSRKVDELHDLWVTLITCFPEIRLNRVEALTRPSEQLHRHLVECEDALLLLTEWMSVDEQQAQTAAQRFAAVQAAIDRVNGPPLSKRVVLDWATDEDTIFDLARRAAIGWEHFYAP